MALLVWGTHIVRTGILRVFGADLRRFLSKSIANKPSAFLSGLAVTALVQSSSATSLIESSFVAQGLIGLGAALVVMLGADVGTAIMALVLSLDLRWLSPLLIFFGVVFFLSLKNTRAGQGRSSVPRSWKGRSVTTLNAPGQDGGRVRRRQGCASVTGSPVEQFLRL